MIFLLFLHRFIQSVKEYPRISVLFTSDSFGSDINEKIQALFIQHIEEIQTTCDEIEDEEIKNDCVAFKNSYINFFTSKGVDISYNLQCIPKKTDILYIYTDGISTTFDFNNLKSHLTVILQIFDFSFLASEQKFIKILSDIHLSHHDNKNIDFLNITNRISTKLDKPGALVTVVGNMNSTVSFLSVSALSVKFIGEINCQTLFLMYSEFISTNNYENLEYVDFLIEDYRSFEYNSNINFNVKQMTYFGEYDRNQMHSIRVSFGSYSSTVEAYSPDGTYHSYDSSVTCEIGYIFSSVGIDVNVLSNSGNSNDHLLNLTVLDLFSLIDMPMYEIKETNKMFDLSSTGISEFSNKIPEFVINYDHTEYVLNKTSLVLNFNDYPLYTLVPKGEIEDDFICSNGEIIYDSSFIPTNNENDNYQTTNIESYETISTSSNNIIDYNSNSDLTSNDWMVTRSDRSYTYSRSFSITLFLLRSVSFSYSYSFSNIYMINSDDGEMILSKTISLYFLPYIIHYLSPSYVQIFIPIIIKKRGITGEQLIGITCGSAAIFFFILYLIIRIIKKRNKTIDFYEWTITEEEEEVEEGKPEQNKNIIYDDDSSSSNDNFWL